MQQLRRWSVDPTTVRSSSVYTALSRLEQEELIEPRGPAAASGTDRQPRLTYGATPAGEARLDEWLATPPATDDELRLRIALARPKDLELLIDFAIAAEEECLDRLQEIEGMPPGSSAPSWERLCVAILTSLDAVELAGRARWLQDVRIALESMRDHPSRNGIA